MARVRMITRTVDVANVEVMCMDIETAEVKILSEKVIGLHDADSALKVLQKNNVSDTLKYVHVNKIEQEEVLYGMTEEEFIKLAKVLPPRKTNDSDN